MNCKLYDLDKKELGEVTLDESVFGLEVRPDIIKAVIDWQLAKRQAGTHNAKTITEISGTTRKPFKQKGTGRARQGSLRSVQMRGGAVSHGPLVRSHAYSLPKKVRQLGLKHALSAKAESEALYVVKDLDIQDGKTKTLISKISNFGFKSYFVIDAGAVNENFIKASSNIFSLNAVPTIGANVYDIIRHECLIITESAIASLMARLNNDK